MGSSNYSTLAVCKPTWFHDDRFKTFCVILLMDRDKLKMSGCAPVNTQPHWQTQKNLWDLSIKEIITSGSL